MRFLLAFIYAVAIAAPSVSTETDYFFDRMIELLLDGENLPVDIKRQIMELDPNERFNAIIFLRRSGLLDGPAWPLDELLEAMPASRGGAGIEGL